MMSDSDSGDLVLASTPDSDPCRVLPEELWRVIFSHLTDYQICTSIIPVCRHFREIALTLLFRRLNDSGAVNLGQDWMQWHRIPTNLLHHAGISPKSLEFRTSLELHTFLADTSIPFQLGLFRGYAANGNPIERDAISAEARRRMVEAVTAFPRIQSLSIKHCSLERFEGKPPTDASATSSNTCVADPTITGSNHPLRSCPSAFAHFIRDIISPVRHHLKELDFSFDCVCDVQQSHTGRHHFNIRDEGDLTHSAKGKPYFTPDAIKPIARDCISLTSLTLHNCPAGNALSLIAQSSPNLEQLHLEDCSQLRPCQLGEFGAVVSEQNLCTNLKSIRLKDLVVSLMPPAAINSFFGTNVALSQKLTALGIGYEIDEMIPPLQLNQVFHTCKNLQKLSLSACLTSLDFQNLVHLKSLRYETWPSILGGTLPDTDAAPVAPNLYPTSFLTQIPPLVELDIGICEIPHPFYSDEFFQRCFGGIQSLCLRDTGDQNFRNAAQFVNRVLSACRQTLRSFTMEEPVRNAQPLTDVLESDFQLTHLNLSRGGEKVFQMLQAPNLRHLVHFKFREFLPNDFDRLVSAPIVGFIERVCEASAHSLRYLEINCNFPVERMAFVTKMKRVEVLRLGVCTLAVTATRVFPAFVTTCNHMFPIDKHDKDTDWCLDEVGAFPHLKEFDVGLSMLCYPANDPSYWTSMSNTCFETGNPDFCYTIRKTCFGQVKRFLSCYAKAPGCMKKTQFIQLDPIDVVKNSVPNVVLMDLFDPVGVVQNSVPDVVVLE